MGSSCDFAGNESEKRDDNYFAELVEKQTHGTIELNKAKIEETQEGK